MEWKQKHDMYLSDSKTKCWLSMSCRAFASNLLSASTIEILPQVTCNGNKIIQVITRLASEEFLQVSIYKA